MTPSAIMTMETKEVTSAALPASESSAAEMEPLISGLPDEVAEQCLLHLPFPYQALARSVSSAWNRALSSSAFLRAKSELSATLSLPYLFVCASPRAGFYNADRDAWEEMSEGMREGWTGASAVVGGRLLVVTDYGDGRVMAYDAGSDA